MKRRNIKAEVINFFFEVFNLKRGQIFGRTANNSESNSQGRREH